MKIPGSEMFIDMLSKKEQVIASILKDLEQCDVQYRGLERFVDTIEDCTEEELRRKLKVMTKNIRKQSDIFKRVLMLLLVYTSGNNYDSDVSRLLIKLGRGEEALQEILKQKMKGN